MGTNIRRLCVTILVPGFLFIACDEFPEYQAVGVTLEDDRPVVHYIGACDEDEEMQSLSIIRDTDVEIPNDEEPVIWRVVSNDPSRTSADEGSHPWRFLVDEPPPGFSVKVPFGSQAAPTGRLVVSVNTNKTVDAAVDFEMSELREGQVTAEAKDTDRGNVALTYEAFRRRAEAICD